jgi:hypothetical protein
MRSKITSDMKEKVDRVDSNQQRLDEPLGVIDGLADLRAHRHHLCRCRVRFGEHDLERAADDGQRCAQLMAACEDHVALANRIGDGLRDAG